MPDRFTVMVPGVTLVNILGIGFNVGASFTDTTVNTNDVLAVATPSLTVNVINVVPKRFVAGVMVTLRLAPYPSGTMLATGTSAALVEVAVTVRAAIGVSMSPTVKGTLIEVSSLTDCAVMPEMVGASFTGFTVRRKLFVVE